MQRRPKETYLKVLRREEPAPELRQQLVILYRKSAKAAKNTVWVHLPLDVDDSWYGHLARDPMTKTYKYEFGRYVAVQNNGILDIVGAPLWMESLHSHYQPPVIVTDRATLRQGYIIGYNHFEVLVEWEDPITKSRQLAVPIRNLDQIEFKFLEDHIKYHKIFSKIKR